MGLLVDPLDSLAGTQQRPDALDLAGPQQALRPRLRRPREMGMPPRIVKQAGCGRSDGSRVCSVHDEARFPVQDRVRRAARPARDRCEARQGGLDIGYAKAFRLATKFSDSRGSAFRS